MRLIGLKIERMDPTIQKVLSPGWYPFGDYEEPKASGFLYLKPVSITENNLRLAMLYVQGGRWQGRQIIPEAFIRESLSIQTDTSEAPEQRDGRCGYGYQLWACSIPGVFRFDGGQGQYGIIWPENIAPYKYIILIMSSKDETQNKVANDLYDKLTGKGVEVILDDRDERPGVKFNDAELIGIPYRITVGHHRRQKSW